ncbi:MAG TPA: NAD(P)/FAD-dependent oxidoreductase [Chthoniobacterales bacterium]|jgi:glutathione reductase (NADPH)|nr:NAD(P)/FAD-dependent oxidoreductase [Chthoniobacterales bacterium]
MLRKNKDLGVTRKFDLVVIGTGTAGGSAGFGCRSAGWKVAIVDSRPFGGTCALRGCDPKKVLVDATEVIERSRGMAGKGVSNGLKMEWPALMRFERTFTQPVPADREQGFSEAGIAVFHGRARFIDKTTIQVGSKTLIGRFVLIATGAWPARLHIPGEEHLTTSDNFLELDVLPRRILFVGGGYISFEFAHVSARSGAQVQILHRSARPLEEFDPDMVARLVKATEELGVAVRLNTAVQRIDKSSGHFTAHASVNGAAQAFEGDMVVHGAGRLPEIDDLDLEKAGIEREKRGVIVNEYLQSISTPAVYAAGDAAATGAPRLTPVAAMEGEVVAANLLKGNHRKPDYAAVASIVFTLPSVARVGLPESTAKERGLKFRVNHQDTSDWNSSRRLGAKHSAFKVLIEEGSDRILGAHVIGPHTEEQINLFTLAIRSGIRASDIEQTLFAYPTGASDLSYMV